MSGIRHTPPPVMHHAQAAAHTAPTQQAQQHAAAQQQPQTTKSQQPQKSYSGGQAGPTGKRPAVPTQPGTTRTRRRAPVSGGGNLDNEDNSFGSNNPDDPEANNIAATTGLGGRGARQQEGTRDGKRGSGAQDRQSKDPKDKRPMTHSRNMGNTGNAGVRGQLAAYMTRVAAKPLSALAFAKQELAIATNYVKGLAGAVVPDPKAPPDDENKTGWRKRLGQIKGLEEKLLTDMQALGVTKLTRENLPTPNELILRNFPKPDRSKGPPSPDQASLNCMVKPLVLRLYKVYTKQQFNLACAHQVFRNRASGK
jgi:hypothetical protein